MSDALTKFITEPQPQPEPNNGPSCHDLAVQRLRELEVITKADLSYAIAAIEARKQMGIEKYGTILQRGNGRNPIADACQELTDALAYFAQADAMDGWSFQLVASALNRHVKNEVKMTKTEAPEVRAGQRWLHFKGGYYMVVAIVPNEADDDNPIVIYGDDSNRRYLRSMHGVKGFLNTMSLVGDDE